MALVISSLFNANLTLTENCLGPSLPFFVCMLEQ